MINMFACVVYSTSYLTVNFNFKLCVTLNPLQESTEEALFNVSFNVSAVSTICLVYKQMYCIACRVFERLCRHTAFSTCNLARRAEVKTLACEVVLHAGRNQFPNLVCPACKYISVHALILCKIKTIKAITLK